MKPNISDWLNELKSFAENELTERILPFWAKDAVDHENGGFVGRISEKGKADPDAGKGLVLNARILWTFSAAYRLFMEDSLLIPARRAYYYLMNYFHDRENGGFYWFLDSMGNPVETKKQTYAQAFVIYGLSELYQATKEQIILDQALNLFNLLEEKTLDKSMNGYLEAFSMNWGAVTDNRLSVKDMNERKSMNTHLHLVEAYSCLLGCCQDIRVTDSLKRLIGIFKNHIINPENNHLNLFFDDYWNPKSNLISYGHDIEASWLLYEAVSKLNDKHICNDVAGLSVSLANAALEGINKYGGLNHEADSAGISDGEMEWWVQAEAVTGFFNAWQMTGDIKYLKTTLELKNFIQNYFVDSKYGEWFYRVDRKARPIAGYDKAGFWKCPYHNGRMCMELIKRIQQIQSNNYIRI